MKEPDVRTHVDDGKQRVRERVWDLLDAEGVVLDATAHGRIPNYKGSDIAAARLAGLRSWRDARVIKAVPDKAQLPVRACALAEGKTVYMAVPKLADPRPFYLLDPVTLPVPPHEAANSKIAATVAPRVHVTDLQPVDMIVVGSVAVNRAGARLGKGAGYSDLEFAFLMEAGLISDRTVVVSTVHSLQVLDEEIPSTDHDFEVDLIVTPDEVIPCPSPNRPTGLVWEHLDPEKIASIPLLAARASTNGG
jgi:5-formyltetrahydrofolate cyclo-ligase